MLKTVTYSAINDILVEGLIKDGYQTFFEILVMFIMSTSTFYFKTLKALHGLGILQMKQK